MGIFSSLGSFFGIGKKNVNILIVGLDNSGKTTLINRLKPEIKQSPTVVPTVGYLVEKFNYQNFQIQAYDMAGQAKYRDNWETFLPGVHGIIFVVDSSDKLRMPVARDEIFGLLDKMEVPLIFFANKMDLLDSQKASDVSDALGLNIIRRHKWGIYSSNAVAGDGVEDGMNWLGEQMQVFLNGHRSKI